jgi:hypothetical protein
VSAALLKALIEGRVGPVMFENPGVLAPVTASAKWRDEWPSCRKDWRKR